MSVGGGRPGGPRAPSGRTTGVAGGFRDRVESVVAALAPGEVVTYGEVAAQAGSPGAARGVGAVLRTSQRPLPWWRVVAAGGRIAAPAAAEQARLLRREGVDVRGRVVRFAPVSPGWGAEKPPGERENP